MGDPESVAWSGSGDEIALCVVGAVVVGLGFEVAAASAAEQPAFGGLPSFDSCHRRAGLRLGLRLKKLAGVGVDEAGVAPSATFGPMDLARRIAVRGSEFLLFAVTPPRITVTPERAQEIADVTQKRLTPLGLDGLVLYDIDDESGRNPQERPFPFLPTIDPATFRAQHLTDWTTPVVVYRAVGKYGESDLRAWLEAQDADHALTVFVGASSQHMQPATSLVRAQELWAQTRPDLRLGGVAIPERHTRRGEEHLRLIAKQEAGCSFFVTQVVYDVNAAKNLVSDYRYECAARGLEPVPIVFTFSVCGSLKTLEFLGWLGVDVPRWIHNDLRHADDTLQASYEHSLGAARELIGYCRRMGVPFGVNVESVSIRLAEIEASVDLAQELDRELRR